MSRLNPDPNITFKMVGQFVWKYYKRKPWALVVVVFLFVVQACFELLSPWLLGQMIDSMTATKTITTETFSTTLWYLLPLALSGLGYHFTNKGTNLFYDFFIKLPAMRDSGQEVFAKVQRFSLDWHNNSFAGSIVTKQKRGVAALERFGDCFYGPFLRTFILVSAIIIFLFFRWPVMGWLFLSVSLFYLCFSIAIVARYIAPISRESAIVDSKLGGQLADSITGNITVKSFAQEQHEDRLFARVVTAWMSAIWSLYIRLNVIDMVQNTTMTAIKMSLFGLIIYLWTQGQATIGDVVFIIGVYSLLSGYLRQIGNEVRQVQRAANDMEEMVSYSLEPLQVKDKPRAKRLKVKKGGITFSNLTFGYEDQARKVFKNFNLTIEPGQKVALVGHSGSGKSTLMKLIQRFYDIEVGSIQIDGQDISFVTQKSLRQAVALVPQDPILFHRSLAENIGYGAPKIDQKRLLQASKQAYAHNFIKDLPQQYDTLVGERGVKLSGGERQRVAIARAIACQAPILVLDEATSALDSESEKYIQAALEKLTKGKTSLIIAHRLSTIKNADRILVFDQGKIIEDGTHEELLKQPKGHYKKLFEMQAGGFIND